MDKEVIAAASAIAGATVAAVTVYTIDRLRRVKDQHNIQGALQDTAHANYTRGWYEGREALLRTQTGEVEIFSTPA